MLGTTLAMEFGPDKAWSEKEQAYKSSGLFSKTAILTHPRARMVYRQQP